MSAEQQRLIENMLCVGTVLEVDERAARVRVSVGELATAWLPWTAPRAGLFRVWAAPSQGEQLLLACIGGNPETAIVIGSIYSESASPPGADLQEIVITAPDGARIRYDAAAGELLAEGVKTARITASTSVTLETPVVECTQHLVTNTFELKNGGTLRGNVTHSSGQLSSNGVIVDKHVHTGVQGGSSNTGGPK